MRRLVRWLSLTFADFDLGGFSVRGLTCAAHIAGANKSPPTITIRRRQRTSNLDIEFLFLCLTRIPCLLMMHEACQWPALTGNVDHVPDTTGVTLVQQ